MASENNTEVKNETAEEMKTEPAGKRPENRNTNKYYQYLWMGAAFLAVLLIMLINFFKTGGSSTAKCQVVPQAAFGQSQAQGWTEMKGPADSKAIAGFELDVPDDPAKGYEEKVYRVFTKQIYEITYYNDADHTSDHEGMRIVKGIMCGQPVYDINKTYPSQNIVTVDNKEVTEYGDGDMVSVATWTDGEYSYAVGCWNVPIDKKEMESLIPNIK